MKMGFGTKRSRNPNAIAYFMHSDNDQKDRIFLPSMKRFLGAGFDFFPKSVCFHGAMNKKIWKGVCSVGCSEPICNTCACVSSFYRRSRTKIGQNVHVALVEGPLGLLPEYRIPAVATGKRKGRFVGCNEFHSCLVIVDPINKRILVFNPWKEDERRSGSISSVNDIRPRLVRDLVQRYRGYKVFHQSGKQIGTSDCRVHCIKFARALGGYGIQDFIAKIAWKPLHPN